VAMVIKNANGPSTTKGLNSIPPKLSS